MALILFFSLFTGVNKAKAQADLNVNADGAILVDGKTGRVLYEKNADTPLGIASMTKMMTEYMLLDAIKKGKVSWDQTYTVDDEVYKMSQDRSLSNVPLRQGGQYNVKELYQAVAIYSADAAAIALAEIMGGSETNFVKMMNAEAEKLGLKHYKFVNASGLNNADYKGMQPSVGGPTDENLMSTRDVATLAFHLINDFPEVLQTSSIPKMTFRQGTKDAINMPNWNWMLPSLVYGYQGMDGLKTGHTDFAGYCFTGTAERDGKRFITVVQNAKDANGKGGYSARFSETRKMLDYAFSNYSKQQIFPKHYEIKGNKTVPVINGKSSQVEVYTNSALSMLAQSGEKQDLKPVIVLDKSKVNSKGELTAPVKKGEKVGYLMLESKNGDKLSFVTPEGEKKAQVDVVASQDVDKANWFVLMMKGIGHFFSNVWHKIFH
ncbi:D-alanyl-D-alanine carboxypeptidase [Bacillus sp. BRMEA1]|uniref:serine hydrolase n=1 Tax=Neobacillus endophyticus TaxID=2738405 RepID=UPI001563534B|nr:D-alanyl-D-alanine carboxypeptidase [Neobacillus endophyticus]